MELTETRSLTQTLLSEHSMLPYEPKKDWRFVDCKLKLKFFKFFKKKEVFLV